MKQYLAPLFFLLFICFISCNEQDKPESINDTITEQVPVPKKESNGNTTTSTEIDRNIRSIFQDRTGRYWFGTNGAGVYRYDGKTLLQFTVKDGLQDNQVQSIQEDESGNMWFGTGVFGVSRFDGRSFTAFANKENLQVSNGSDKNWKIEPNDLWFYAGGGVYRYDGHSFVYLPLGNAGDKSRQSKNTSYQLSPYAVYSILKDRRGNVWFGTQAEGVCRYDGRSFTWFNEKGLAGPAVLGLFEDRNGNLWFGNNGAGLFRYDGKSLVNFTEEKGLGTSEFRASGKPGAGTMARIYSINEDNNGNLWIGTVDAGVWRYDGNNLTNYTTADGLTSNAINTVYKDRNGELWFGTDGDGICKFNGSTFSKFEIK